MSPGHLVNSATAARARDAARQLEFQPDPAGRTLKTRRSYTVGVLIPDLANPLFPPIVGGIEDTFGGHALVALPRAPLAMPAA